MSAAVVFDNVSKEYGGRTVLDNLNLTIETGDFMVIFGPPSSGKSVLLRLLMGLDTCSVGQIRLRGTDALHMSAGERNIGYVPQSFALYPHLSVFENIAYPLRLIGMSKAEIDPLVKQVADMLKIEMLLAKRPDQLSGGQKQRVAIARGIVKQTDIFILDDPLAGLDFKLREQLIDDLKELQEKVGLTFVYSTSDPIEAMSLGKHIAILDDGKIVECGTPDHLYHTPSSLTTINLFGFPKANFLRGKWVTHSGEICCETDLFTLSVDYDRALPIDTSASSPIIAFRPESIKLEKDDSQGWFILSARVLLREDLGGEEIVYLEIDGVTLTCVVLLDYYEAAAHEKLMVYVKQEDVFIYDPASGRLIGKGGGIEHVGNQSGTYT